MPVIDRYFLPVGRSAANPPAAVAAVDRWDRHTDGRSTVSSASHTSGSGVATAIHFLLTYYAGSSNNMHREAEKRNEFSFVCILISYLRKLVIFFTHIRPKETRSIRYDSVYLILARVENFAATVTLNH